MKPSVDLLERGSQSCAENVSTPVTKTKKERLVKTTAKKRRRKSKKRKARKRRKAGEKVSVTAHQRKNLDRVFQFALTKGFTEENWKNVARSIRTVRAVKIDEAASGNGNTRLSAGLNLLRTKYFNMNKVILGEKDKKKIEKARAEKLGIPTGKSKKRASKAQTMSRRPARSPSPELPDYRHLPLEKPDEQTNEAFGLDLSSAGEGGSDMNLADLPEEDQNKALDQFLTFFG